MAKLRRSCSAEDQGLPQGPRLELRLYPVPDIVSGLMAWPMERLADYFGREKHERLRALKRTWDPENVFHRNKNIEP
ncbi:hypothetical protein BO221_49990 [Archangium sp. Cb G35]|uniref:BBE domain-containing protein n=1 Tax=Archangium sp. Cb G35 TaxID=1920190 RepID=UPI0009379576|nr:BBE domain-containing protein [Archangium sp. Cb G35]OJT16459.1 hypothetical protein BO221_49990 [Archangium sp. Cb G35]